MAPELKQIAEQLSSLSAQRARDLINGNPKQADLVRSQISSLKKRRLTILSAHGLPSDHMIYKWKKMPLFSAGCG